MTTNNYWPQKLDVIDVVNRIFIATDERNWDQVQGCFAGEVMLDYTSLGGGKTARLTPREIVESWKGLLPGFQATQHAISNHVVTVQDKEATCFCYGTAVHFLPLESGKNSWTVVGTYNFHLEQTAQGWLVDQMKFNLKWMEGNNDLSRIAQQRLKGRW